MEKEVTNELTMKNLKYEGCSIPNVAPVTVTSTGCDYLFEGTGAGAGTVTIHCETGKTIEMKATGIECTVTISSQGPLKGIKFHNINAMSEITVETTVAGIIGVVDGNGCPSSVGAGNFTEGEYTTGNTIWTGSTDPANAMALAWFE